MTMLPPTPLPDLPTSDLIALFFIVSTGISELRLTVPGRTGLDLLRSELRRRELTA